MSERYPVRILALLLPVAFLAAQSPTTPDQSVSVSASRTITLPAEEAVFDVTVATGTGVALPVVLNLLEPAGVKEENLIGVSGGGSFFGITPVLPQPPIDIGGAILPRPQTTLQYQFTFTRPAAQLKETLDRLDAIAGRRGENIIAVTHQSFLSASARQIEQARGAVLRDLLAETRRHGEVIARASNFTLGSIQYVSENTSGFQTGRFLTPFAVMGTRITFVVSVRYGRQ